MSIRLKTVFHGLAILMIISSCGVPQTDYDKLIEENQQLTVQLEECENGAEKVIAKVEKAYSEKNYSLVKENIKILSEKHPESPKNKEFKLLLSTIEKQELAEQKKKEAEEKERIRLANINNMGMWRTTYYVDDFGEPTKEGYITNKSTLKGTFSNTATQNSDLNIRFLISNSTDISFKLFEYAGNNPVKAYSSDSYRVLVQDKDGKRYKLTATNYSDRLSFNKTMSRTVHNILLKGGTVKFKIVEIDTPTTEYEFTIQKADYYDNTYRIFRERK
ncbi:hypothetical protein KO507_00195 [Gilvimarinus agarilyticus]|uniref:hypothetical protein n=1 Tax=Reichenbachiella agariperforans TaxID=156994 RepID=UPI001C092528|nr:hypothetical protein [Reichenbachiella agariperforans]MBU2884175.1 hypothetical protein [Gilvimarinus agarilyticus]MBU2912801.1 hypothetical protein [Reichenbachiella agariperforans]